MLRLNGKIPGTENFKWHEVLFLASWNIYVYPHEKEIENNIIKTVRKLQQIRDVLKKPLLVTSLYRPKSYNAFLRNHIHVATAENSLHVKGLAADFVVYGHPGSEGCQEIRELLDPHLEKLNIRMKDAPNSNHVHIDLGEVKNKRYFTV